MGVVGLSMRAIAMSFPISLGGGGVMCSMGVPVFGVMTTKTMVCGFVWVIICSAWYSPLMEP